jgi:hypothetical protein
MVSSLDLDGIVSAMLMHSLRGWELVGFYDAQYLWIKVGVDYSRGKVVFLDHDIYHPQIPSVGHHILQWQKGTQLPGHEKSLNPNLLRGITAQEFGRKYPFATFHFLLACMSAWHPEWSQTLLCLPRKFLPVLLNVDSSMQNAFTYLRNAMEWLAWLGGSEEDSPLYPFCRLLLSISPRRLIEWGVEFDDAMKSRLGAGSPYTKRRPQAQQLNPTDPQDWGRLSQLIDWLASLIPSWRLKVPDFPHLAKQNQLQVIKLNRERGKATKKSFDNMLKNPHLFSYAIISKGKGGLNYSLLP